jgi:hypothetical protein
MQTLEALLLDNFFLIAILTEFECSVSCRLKSSCFQTDGRDNIQGWFYAGLRGEQRQPSRVVRLCNVGPKQPSLPPTFLVPHGHMAFILYDLM